MTLVGLDLNATRARAVAGQADALVSTLLLEEGHSELPLALSLEGRQPQVGSVGIHLCRRLPHLACVDFLAALGERREWVAGRHRLDAAKALSLVLERLQLACADAKGVVLALPSYLSRAQVALLLPLATKARLPVVGSVTAPLAVALAASGDQPEAQAAVVLDLDDHALTLTLVAVAAKQARVLAAQAFPQLSLRIWKGRLLDAVADRCIRHTRRDPRESAVAEQSLYDQLDGAMDACRQGRLVEFAIQGAQWYQNLMLRPEELVAFCARMVHQVVQGVRSLLPTAAGPQAPAAVLLTEAAGRLPGLVAALQQEVPPTSSPMPAEPTESPEDFGENLLLAPAGEPGAVVVLPADAVARAAQALASCFLRGDLPRGHLDSVAPLLSPQREEVGPARLHFRGKDYLLTGLVFTLGRQPGCDLVFDGTLHPDVAPRHCEIVFDHHTYILKDRSRTGTLVNERPVHQQIRLRPGDWIRLGPDGPLVRFLGQTADESKLGTTA